MTEALWIAAFGLVGTLGAAAFLLVRGLRESKTTAAANASAAAQTAFAANIELNKYIDERVAAALTEPRGQIAELERQVERLTLRERTTKDILRRWVQRLLWWDSRGRAGDMPMPSAADMATLDLTDLEGDTLTATEVAAIRDSIPKDKE